MAQELDGLLGPPELAETLEYQVTTNQSACGSHLLDFFFQVLPKTPEKRIIDLLRLAWREDSITALKLVAQLQEVRGTGKSNRKAFYICALWMFRNHPKTLIKNAKTLSQFGYFKDLLELLRRIIESPNETRNRFKRTPSKKRQRRNHISSSSGHDRNSDSDGDGEDSTTNKKFKKIEDDPNKKLLAIIEKQAQDKLKGVENHKEAITAHKRKRIKLAQAAVLIYHMDINYRGLHDEVAQIFADMLAQDLEILNSQQKLGLSLAAKWCPSLNSSYDKATLITESIAKKLFPRRDEEKVLEERQYIYRVRDRLRKEVLVPLRKALELPEVFMSSNEWENINYDRVGSLAMRNYHDIFTKHDNEKFSKYMEDVVSGKKKIVEESLLPHEILQSAIKSPIDGEVAELQWKEMVERLKECGTLSNSLAICDVSGSMDRNFMDACIALGILVSQLSENPWRRHVGTFSETPELNLVEGKTLFEKHSFMKKMNWGFHIDFPKLFDSILDMAEKFNVPPERMIKQLFVLTDMEFDKACENPWETDYMMIKSKFSKAGYGLPPKIVFWNFRESEEPKSHHGRNGLEGVAMVFGFSKNTLKLFLRGPDNLSPMVTMNRAIQGELFNKLLIVD